MTKFENIPTYLKKYGLFCLWRYEVNHTGRKIKAPYNPNNSQCKAKTNNRSTFAKLDITVAEAKKNDFEGLGLGIFDSVAAIDIDDCIKDGKLSTMATTIVELMDTYTEVSPSGKGLRILFLAPKFRYDDKEYYINNQKNRLEILK